MIAVLCCNIKFCVQLEKSPSGTLIKTETKEYRNKVMKKTELYEWYQQ